MTFDYDLHLLSLPGASPRTVICFHGYGGNYTIAEQLKQLNVSDATFVGFNFPDYDLQTKVYDPRNLSFGTIRELLPAAYVLKKFILDEGLGQIDLYGRSAGGGALINLLAILNTSTYDKELKHIGIGTQEKSKLLRAIQHGLIILDVPLKSVEEIIDLRGSSTELEILAENYRNNHLRPIDTVQQLQGLSLNVILYFEEKDEISFNRDDALFIERLKKANRLGSTWIMKGSEGGHRALHLAPWSLYAQEK